MVVQNNRFTSSVTSLSIHSLWSLATNRKLSALWREKVHKLKTSGGTCCQPGACYREVTSTGIYSFLRNAPTAGLHQLIGSLLDNVHVSVRSALARDCAVFTRRLLAYCCSLSQRKTHSQKIIHT